MQKPNCVYGSNCYRQNPIHFEQFGHPQELLDKLEKRKQFEVNPSSGNDTRKKVKKPIVLDETIKRCHGFFLTEISKKTNNDFQSISLKSILAEENGKLIDSIHFNFMFDFKWLIDQYPTSTRNYPIYIVCGIKKDNDIEMEAKKYEQIILCPIQINDRFGTHHTKMMILHYETGIRIIIHTANLIASDWVSKTQGLWISPTLYKLSTSEDVCKTNFKNDFLEYLSNYNSRDIDKWRDLIGQYDFSPINVYLVGSVPGCHRGQNRSSFGHLKLRKLLRNREFGPTRKSADWPVISQFSSIGSLGPQPDNWLMSQFLSSLSSIYDEQVTLFKPSLKCIYPTVENVRLSIEGYSAGTSLPYSKFIASKQKYLEKYLYQWKASVSERDDIMPHIKSYFRLSSDFKDISWFCLTSANLSKAAWGELQSTGSQLRIRSYELGVLFLPKLMINKESFKLKASKEESFPLPYDIPAVPYGPEDKPWIWDLNYVDKPDRKGNIWMPNSES